MTHKGSKSPGFKDGRYSKEYFCVDCDKKISKISGLYGNHRCSVCHCLNLGSNINLVEYNNKYFRSSWEANFAKWCDLSGIKWEYESKTFDLGNTTYTPDFYLPEFNCYIEIKGYWWQDAKEKFNKFIKIYPNILMILLQKPELLNMSVIN